ncbi:hypothetical protein [Corynebacterium kozikiae]|uniref:hypothetical protein n=1 Tax=Corynebacterium kozikiae TaxID=2968469 RepID=UPI00211CA7D1|nr:hypothetical protein [Corynebacterium sp. 76QC2CO]MCQ9343246.1 hypothetical protein [Corynebacterium sp. 76QC2CO]
MDTQGALHIGAGERGLETMLQRAVRLDAQAKLRLQQAGEAVNVYVTTPFEVLACRRVQGSAHDASPRLAATWAPATSWPGALPPARGFQLLDTVPVDVAYDLAEQGRGLARQFSGPLGPPASLLNQTVLTVEAGEATAEIPMRMIFACTAMGFIPPAFTAEEDVPRTLRVSTAGSWVRIDAPFGSVYHAKRLNLLTLG